MYAVLETGGKQYRVGEGDIINVEKLDAKAGDTITLDHVLVVENDKDTIVGAPYVAGASVKAVVLEQGKADKVIIFKYKAKKDYRRKKGHRQPYTQLQIKSVSCKKVAEE